jgi:hypothetical protein
LPLNFQTEIKAQHVRAATGGIFRRQILQPVVLGLVAVFLLGMQLTLHVFFSFIPLYMHVLLALLVLGSLGGLLWILQRHYESTALQNFSRFMGARVQVRLSDAAYRYSASWGQGEIAWGQFQSLWRLKDVWVLLQHTPGGISVVLPTADLDAEARDFLTARLRDARAVMH